MPLEKGKSKLLPSEARLDLPRLASAEPARASLGHRRWALGPNVRLGQRLSFHLKPSQSSLHPASLYGRSRAARERGTFPAAPGALCVNDFFPFTATK